MCFRKEESGKGILYHRFCLSYVRKAYQFLFDVWEGKEESEGLRFVKSAPSVHHLLFADDSFIFARGTLQECSRVKLLLKTYEEASGQVINLLKRCVAFSGNLTEYDGQLLADYLGMARVSYHDRYLGLPVFVGKARKQAFAYIKEKLWKRLNGWRGSLFSNAGK